jgi:hypothetical protein
MKESEEQVEKHDEQQGGIASFDLLPKYRINFVFNPE